MKRKTLGFTLIEMVIVIIILGILAVVAVPKFINLSSDAQTAATAGIAGALSSANSTNYAGRSAKATNGVPITNCQDVANALQGGLPTGYTITSLAVAAGSQATCTLTGPSSTTASFTATGIT